MNQETKLLFNYPTTYYDFADGVNIEDDTVNQWIEESITSAVTKLRENNLKESFSASSSGNTKVIVEVYRQESNDKLSIYVSVCKKYKRAQELNISISDIL